MQLVQSFAIISILQLALHMTCACSLCSAAAGAECTNAIPSNGSPPVCPPLTSPVSKRTPATSSSRAKSCAQYSNTRNTLRGI